MSRELLEQVLNLYITNASTTEINELMKRIDSYLEKPLPEPVPGVAIHFGHPALVKIGTENNYDGRLYAEPPARKAITQAELIDEFQGLNKVRDDLGENSLIAFIVGARFAEGHHGITEPKKLNPNLMQSKCKR